MKLFAALAFLLYYLKEMARANVQVALDSVRPRPRIHPALVEFPVEVRTDLQLSLLANLITMTPGTLCVDISEDRRIMVIHTLYGKDPANAIRALMKLEKGILRFTTSKPE